MEGGKEKEKHINGRFKPVLNPTAPDAQVPEYGLFDISCIWVKGKSFHVIGPMGTGMDKLRGIPRGSLLTTVHAR